MAIRSYHMKLKHASVPHTLALVQKEFWIPRECNAVLKWFCGCDPCKIYEGEPHKLLNASFLQRARVMPSVAFYDYHPRLFGTTDRQRKK